MASSYNRRTYSKSQMYFFKILHIISSTPPSPIINNKQLHILPVDLNLSFSSITQQDPQHSQSSSKTTSTNETKHVQEHKTVDDDVAPELENKNEDNPNTSSFQRPRGDKNYLDLLIEAARVLSEKNGSDSEESEKQTGTELMTRVVVDLYESEPVVRSKRGRNRALPCRFRDSVIEPLKRKDRKLRLSSTTIAKKRSYNVKR